MSGSIAVHRMTQRGLLAARRKALSLNSGLSGLTSGSGVCLVKLIKDWEALETGNRSIASSAFRLVTMTINFCSLTSFIEVAVNVFFSDIFVSVKTA